MPELIVDNPYDQKQIATLPITNEADSFKALETAAALYEDRDGWLPMHERIAILERAAQLVTARIPELARLAASEGGKPLTDSLVEIGRGVQGLKAAVAEIGHVVGREIPMGLSTRGLDRIAYTFREPRGVVFAISAFNHPFNLIIHQVIPAIAVGCPVLVKPAKTTPLSCKAIVEILYEAGLPKPWCQMLLCENKVASALVADPRTAFLTFIGSARVGWMLRASLPPGAACALEHGGLAPAIIDETADLDKAVPALLKAGFYHAGQVCVKAQRLYVHDAVADRFIESFVAGAKGLVVGNQLDMATEVGPLIQTREADRVQSWVEEAVQAGGQMLCGGDRLSPSCYSPTVILEPPDNAKLSCEEVFGPALAVYRYSDIDEAIARANAPDVFFQAALWTNKLDSALEISRRLKGMAVMVNDHTAFRVDWMPFGGHRQSGLGAGGLRYAMEDMTLERMVVFKH